jgi:hypothetical protein
MCSIPGTSIASSTTRVRRSTVRRGDDEDDDDDNYDIDIEEQTQIPSKRPRLDMVADNLTQSAQLCVSLSWPFTMFVRCFENK